MKCFVSVQKSHIISCKKFLNIMLFINLLILETHEFPKFTYLRVDNLDKMQCSNLKESVNIYMNSTILQDCPYEEKECRQISNAYIETICTKGKNLGSTLKKISKQTEILYIDAFQSKEPFDFSELSSEMQVEISGLVIDDNSLLSNTNINLNILKFIRRQQNWVDEIASTALYQRFPVNSNEIQIEGDLGENVLSITIYDEANLQFIDDPLEGLNIYIENSTITHIDGITANTVLFDVSSFQNLMKEYQEKPFKLSVSQFGIIVNDECIQDNTTIRLSFADTSVNIYYADSIFPNDYKRMIYTNISYSWFKKEITIVSLAKYYSLYLEDSFDPNDDFLPMINLSIQPHHMQMNGRDASHETIEIKTEASNNPNPWNEFDAKPQVVLSYDANEYDVKAPGNINIVDAHHQSSSKNNGKNTVVIICIVFGCLALIAIVTIILVIIILIHKRNKKAMEPITLDEITENKDGSKFKQDEESKEPETENSAKSTHNNNHEDNINNNHEEIVSHPYNDQFREFGQYHHQETSEAIPESPYLNPTYSNQHKS